MWLLLFCVAIFGTASTERLRLSCGQIRHFVDGHNFRRVKAARGLIPGQPAGSDMKYMVWDEELAEKAARWAENGQFTHNPDRTVRSQRWSLIGENLYISKFYSSVDVGVPPKIEDALDAWFNEHFNYHFEPYTLELAKHIGHYTQMVWASSTRVGCGISQKKVNRTTITLFVCDYGPTLIPPRVAEKKVLDIPTDRQRNDPISVPLFPFERQLDWTNSVPIMSDWRFCPM